MRVFCIAKKRFSHFSNSKKKNVFDNVVCIRLIIQSCATLGCRDRGSFLNAVLFLVCFKININYFPLMENCFSQHEITRKISLVSF